MLQIFKVPLPYSEYSGNVETEINISLSPFPGGFRNEITFIHTP